MLFPWQAAATFILWMICAVIVPDIVPLNSWHIPEKLRPAAIAAAIILAPAAVVAVVVYNICIYAVNYYRDQERRREAEKLNSITFENSRGNTVDGDKGALIIIKKLILTALERNASDIFIDPQVSGSSDVRLRANGSLHKVNSFDREVAKGVVSAIKVIAQMNISEHRLPQDGAFAIKISGMPVSFRVASVGAYSGEKISIRVLGAANGPRKLADLGLADDDLKKLENAVRLPSGMVLLCGPTGSGKTSTLYAMLQNVDFALKNVISIEDPIENIIQNVSQIEVNTKAGVSFASLLRNSLRQNPDILCLGEIRDAETAAIAVQAAQTGHLIIATVHSNDNISTIDRLTTLGIPLRTAASTLQLLISQRLVRTLCPHCKTPAPLPEEYREYFDACGLPADKIFSKNGCPSCDGTGYSGRMAVFDILTMDAKLREMLENEHITAAEVKSFLETRTGGNVIAAKALQLVAGGLTTFEEVNRVSFEF